MLVIHEYSHEPTVSDFLQWLRTGIMQSDDTLDKIQSIIPIVDSKIFWTIVDHINVAVVPKNILLDIINIIFLQPTFLKYIELIFSRYFPTDSYIKIAPDAYERSYAALALAVSHPMMLPPAIVDHLDRLRKLTLFYTENQTNRILNNIPGFIIPQPTPTLPSLVPILIPDDEFTTWEIIQNAFFVGPGYMDSYQMKRQEARRLQIAKLTKLAHEIIECYTPFEIMEQPEFKRALIVTLPNIIEKLFVHKGCDLSSDSKRQVITILYSLVEFLQQYKNNDGSPDKMFEAIESKLDLKASFKRILSNILDKLEIEPDIKVLILISSIFIIEKIVDRFLTPQYIMAILQRLVEEPVDIENYETVEFINPFGDDLDEEYSIQLGNLIYDLVNALNINSLWKNAIYVARKTIGNAAHKFHKDFVAGECSMKPMIILHHLLVKKQNGRITPYVIDQPTKHLYSIIMGKLSDYKIMLAIFGSSLDVVVRLILHVANDQRLLLLFTYYMVQKL